ncbi:M3 family metallopeptidase [Prochlorococcus sp. MIT 1307]|uniref:M3 family metallopeptidase n=1 Tax=Prochlorococcus sp. MIT 1307 TaxID=3096219 RepID=UPI002A7583C2|nr:M3 family metallopeptidase [Prochlorococcus sp. MIT 1307]
MNKKSKNTKVEPLLQGQGIPNYKEITPLKINENLSLLLKQLNEDFTLLEQEINKSLNSKQSLNWDEVMTPLHKLSERLRWSWGVVCHLNGVRNTPELREAYSKKQTDVIRFSNKIGQSKIIHKALCSLEKNSTKLSLNQTQKRILEAELLSMNQRGVGLDGPNQEDFNVASERLAELSTTFSNNVLDATKKWSLLLTKKSDVEGLPPRALELLAASAKESGDLRQDNKNIPTAKEGPWRLGLDMPRYISFMTHGRKREIRECLYKAHVSRASDGDLNNQVLIEEILKLRTQQAKRLGHKSWAELSLCNKMAENIETVEKLLEELRSAAMPAAQKELADLQSCAERHGAKEASKLAPWDINYWSEQLKQEKFQLNQEELRPWFPLPQVLQGLFDLCERLFGIKIEKADGDIPTWHEDVRFFKVLDSSGSDLAYFYLDPYSRPSNKRGGAWMDECLGRSKFQDGKTVLPIAYLICNQTPPTKDKPSLMSFEEVETLFHEFGHGLQHMLTTVDYPQAAGINNVEWDAVELPSQFMENWCLDRKTLMGMAKHWQTGESLGQEEFKKLQLSRTFNSGLATLRQVHFALTDLRLHSEWGEQNKNTPDHLRRQIAQTTTVIPPIKEDQFLCAFSHIFAGGYSAGYYSYKWSEVLSADAYAAFEEVEVDNEEQIKAIGKRFRDTVLSLGGSKSPQDVFKKFRGRSPNTKALIRHSGLSVTD